MTFHRPTLTRQSGISRLILVTLLAVLLVCGGAVASFAQTPPPPKLALPLKCVPGVDCWVFNYVDVDTRKDRWRDYACGRLSYDKHRGVDFAIRDLAVMKQGVPVLASAPGRVQAIRDGMDDVGFTKENRKEISKLGCGNAVMLEHDNGWQTSYCHMRNGSVSVKEGQSVARGEQLGMVGMSGLSEFPHLHLGVRFKGKIVDPFIGIQKRQRCRPGPAPLWDDETLARLPYQGAMLYNVGFTSRRP
ncbi:MAG: M23 family metallopeptidase, partial [Proteobacteria bacterium]|nr:M23 family metallopeptidase [Pseudomonadota bacterium]